MENHGFMSKSKASMIFLGKLLYFTHLTCWAIKGDDLPYKNHHLWVSGEQGSVVIIYSECRQNNKALMTGSQFVVYTCLYHL